MRTFAPWIKDGRRNLWEAHRWQACETCGLTVDELKRPPPAKPPKRFHLRTLTPQEMIAEGYQPIEVTTFGDREPTYIRGPRMIVMDNGLIYPYGPAQHERI